MPCHLTLFTLFLQLVALQESLAAESATASAYAALKKETKSNRKQLDKLLAENRMLGQKVHP